MTNDINNLFFYRIIEVKSIYKLCIIRFGFTSIPPQKNLLSMLFLNSMSVRARYEYN